MCDSRDVQALGNTGACTHEYGVEAAGEQIVDCQFLAHGRRHVEYYAEILDFLDFVAHDIFRKPVFGDAEHQYAARLWLHLEDFHGKAPAGQVACDGESGRSAADDGHAAARLLGQTLVRERGLGVEV